jgi:Protein of unknown function (DUF3431)
MMSPLSFGGSHARKAVFVTLILLGCFLLLRRESKYQPFEVGLPDIPDSIGNRPLSKPAGAITSAQGTSKTLTKHLIVASIKGDKNEWIKKFLPDWVPKIYVVNDPKAKLRVPMNKGREAMVYLTYAIPRTTAFKCT